MTDVFLMLIVLILAAVFVLLGRIERRLISRDRDEEPFLPLKKFGGRKRESRGKWHERWERADE